MATRIRTLVLRIAMFGGVGRQRRHAKDRGRELVEDVCTYCHNLDRLRGKELSREEWRGLTKGMISEGAPVTDEEFSMILDYLTKNYGKSTAMRASLFWLWRRRWPPRCHLLAHHELRAEFDQQKPVSLRGIVTRFEWNNPHAFLYVDVKDASGEIVNWAVEWASPLELRKSRLDQGRRSRWAIR